MLRTIFTLLVFCFFFTGTIATQAQITQLGLKPKEEVTKDSSPPQADKTPPATTPNKSENNNKMNSKKVEKKLPEVSFDQVEGDGKSVYNSNKTSEPNSTVITITDKLNFKRPLRKVYANMLVEYSLGKKRKTGKLKIRLYHQRARKTVQNFVNLVEGKSIVFDTSNNTELSKPFYDGLKFHRIIKNFVAQTGDPTGKGKGDGPGYTVPLEFSSVLVHDRKGVVSMARSGRQSHGSQFFITFAPVRSLDNINTVFGQVIDGDQVLQDLERVKTNRQDVPKKDVIIKSITIDRIYM